MRFAIIIPAHNEAAFLPAMLQSLFNQSLPASEIVVVDDHSSDSTPAIVEQFMDQFPHLKLVRTTSAPTHAPGSKIVEAFYQGYEQLQHDFDVVCKYDADLIFPPDYLETLAEHFQQEPKRGMVGGFCYIEKNNGWVLESLTSKDHIRGALKAYRKACFEDIGGLKPSMGWDTADELLAQYYGWEVFTDEALKVKHLRPTGATYSKEAQLRQGEAFYKLRYDFSLTLLASAKLALNKKKPGFVIKYLQGYFRAKRQGLPYLVGEKEGAFIRRLRYRKIKQKFFS